MCHARCIVIIGNEFKPTDQKVENLAEAQEVNNDLYIVLAALELDSVLKLYISRLHKKKKFDVTLPMVVQEVYNVSTVNFLNDEYTLSSTRGVKPWFKSQRRNPRNTRGISMEEDTDAFEEATTAYNIEVGMP